jgi:RsiW-degrading membrane proteinase PrsW (M82 family)
VFAIVPMVTYLWLIWLMDRYDREPIGLVTLNFFWGAVGAIILAIVGSVAMSAVLNRAIPDAFAFKRHIDAVIVAPAVEEPMKALFLLWTARDRRFDNITDGLVYGMAIGLGFGMTENFMYFLGASSVGEWLVIVIIRTLFSAVMHAMATGTVGAFIGATKFGPASTRWPLRFAGLALAMLMHFIWNASVSSEGVLSVGLGFLFIMLSVVVILVVMQISVKKEALLIRRELEDEAALGVLPVEHVPYLASTSGRRRKGWLPATVNTQEYVRSATRLAFRKAQAAHVAPTLRASYEAEITALRIDIAGALRSDNSSAETPSF